MNESIAYFTKNLTQINPESRLVLAVSGGIDSMVMAHIFNEIGFQLSICHVNHGLRGEASDEDERFVQAFAAKLGVACFCHNIGAELREATTGNMHQIARQLRYQFFESIRLKQQADFILTAHHRDDSNETMIQHFFRGTGLDGLKGIPSVNGYILRPFNQISKAEIMSYAKENEVPFREDESNLSNKYTRNKVRLDLLPLLDTIFPNVDARLDKTRANLQADAELLDALIEEKVKPHIQYNDDEIQLNKQLFRDTVYGAQLLYRMIKAFGFTMDQCQNILSGLQVVGQVYHADNQTLHVGRECLIIKQTSAESGTFYVEFGPEEDLVKIHDEFNLKLTLKPKGDVDITEHAACLDRSKIKFPIVIRQWKPGDYLVPIGMSGKAQKISKVLKHYKVDPSIKQEALVMLSNDEIAWLIPYRISENFKITPDTNEVLCIDLVQ